jgi:hypothetical protein
MRKSCGMKDTGNIHVFLGPTLPRARANVLFSAIYHPPAAMGDIASVAANGAEAIVLVDGVFERGPSVWHKEILWALSLGIPVLGCSSMGALRAAELDGHGMTGFGKVYAEYASGEVTEDDEVAVAHAPEELGWQPLTDAMIDIRHRVMAARTGDVITAEEAEAIITLAKSRFFKERSLCDCVNVGIADVSRRKNVVAWIHQNTISVKQQDCEKLLTDLHNQIERAQIRNQTAQSFESTIYLRRLEKFGFRDVALR